MQIKTLKSAFKLYKEAHLNHRYIHNDFIEPLLEKMPNQFKVSVVGKSVNNKNIYSLTLGTGEKRILLWSQMHGNESTTTKALFDVLNTLQHDTEISNAILSHCTITIIPILNPDGAKAYTRLNANSIDLNRDAQDLSQPESVVLQDVFNDFQPDFCFNLHGQRTVFSVGNTNKPATVSFLAPAQDESCTITETRKKAMEIIVFLNANLQKQIPDQVGIYDDTFNINCVGDTFQSHNVPTILFESGHSIHDYEREVTREYIYQSLLLAFIHIAENIVTGVQYKAYFNMPKNEKCFFDIIIRNAKVVIKEESRVIDIGIMYQEKLIENCVQFVPIIERIDDLTNFYGHKEFDANIKRVLSVEGVELKEGYENDFVLIANEKYSLKLIKS